MQNETPFYIQRLKFEFEKKKEVNPRYSLRAYASYLDINAGTLSRIFNKQRIPSLLLGKQLVSILKLDSSEESLFLDSVAEEKWKERPLRTPQELKNYIENRVDRDEEYTQKMSKAYQIEIDQYRILSDWIHYAILELTFVNDFNNDLAWMSSKLGRSESEIAEAIERLKSLELLKEENGALVKTHHRVTTKDKTQTTKPLQRLQKEMLEQAIEGIDNIPYDKRAAVSMTMAVNPKNIERVRKLFVSFSEEVCDLLEEGEQQDVYNLLINLNPVNTKNDLSKESRNET